MKNRMLLVAGTVLGLTAAASAQTVLASNNLHTSNTGIPGDSLVSYDFSNPGAGFTTIGVFTAPTGAPIDGVTGLDYDGNANNPTLYAATGFGSAPGAVYTVNPNNAQAQLVGFMPNNTPINDLAWDPNTQTMYGVDSSQNLWRGVENPATASIVGNFGIGSGLEVGLGFDSRGNIYVHDLATDAIYTGNAGSLTAISSLHAIPYNSNFSQGLFVDWSRDNAGMHGALNASALTSESWGFGTQVNPGGYNFLGSFAINAGSGLPEVEVGDLTRAPIPAPGTLALLGLGSLATVRRRR